MKFALFAGLLASVAVAAPTEKRAAETYQSMTCIDPSEGFHLISLGGEYTTVGNLSLLNSLATDIMAFGPKVEMYQIGYAEGALAPVDIEDGRPAFLQHWQAYTSACPKSKIVTIGYSVGAAILMDAYCGDPRDPQSYGPLPSSDRDILLANIVYGDLTFVSGERSSKGTCTSGQGVVPRAFPGKCYPFGRKTQSFCDVNDPQCCTAGGDPAVHFTYPSIYDSQATDFVKAKWAYWKKHSK